MLQASDVEWQLEQHSGASGVNDDGDIEEQSEPAETAERPSVVKVQVVAIANSADLSLLAAVICCCAVADVFCRICSNNRLA